MVSRPIAFGERRLVLPAHPDVRRERRAKPPVVGDIRIGRDRSKVLVRVAERDRARVREAEQKVGDIGTGRGAGKRKTPAGVLLRQDVQAPKLEITAERQVVPAARPECLGHPSVRAIVRRQIRRARESGHAARECQGRRAPVDRSLVVARDPRGARDVLAIGEERRHLPRQLGELISHAQREDGREAMRPVDRHVESRDAIRIDESEHIRRVRRRSLIGERPEQLVPGVETVREPRLERVLMHRHQDRRLVVVTSARVDVGRRIEIEERRRLRADARRRDDVAGKRRTGARVDELDGAAERIDALGKIAVPLEDGRDQRRLRAGVVIRRVLVAEKEVGPRSDAGNLQRAGKAPEQLRVVVTEFGRLLAGERKRPAVPGRIPEQDAEAAVIQRSRATPIVAERRQLREWRGGAVVDAAVDQEAVSRISRAIARIASRRIAIGGRCRAGRCADRGALKASSPRPRAEAPALSLAWGARAPVHWVLAAPAASRPPVAAARP